MALDSNERELLAIVHFLTSALPKIRASVVTLHVDSANAALISIKGSNKPRLNAYATLISDLCIKNQIVLNVIWIPRDLNNVADYLSKTVDYEDYSVTEEFFLAVCEDFLVHPVIDLFADNRNAKTSRFFSLTFCPNTLGVDAFSYNWENFGLAWVFPLPRLVLRVLNHLRSCAAKALLLVPQWKTSYYYPALNDLRNSRFCLDKKVYVGKNIFLQGVDTKSYFGPTYSGNVEVWYFDFTSLLIH